MKISIGSDHAGYRLKSHIIKSFPEIEFSDVGTHSENSCDYPDYGYAASKKVIEGEADCAIVICGSGVGISITANKITGIRAALCHNEYMAEMARRHNNANALALGARIIGDDLAVAIVRRWIASSFDGDRHQARIDKISKIERAID